MQVINDAPVAHPKPVPVTPLKLGDVVVRRIRADRNIFDLGHNSLLPVRRKARLRRAEKKLISNPER
jgi:hypothetical protein